MNGSTPRSILSVRDLKRRYDNVWAVRGVSFEVYEGEILVLLGPSGCGKSTTLRMLAGLERPQGGVVALNAHTIIDVEKGISLPPERRNMGMVFQSFAVWPHMTVADHVAFPLLVRRYRKSDIQARVEKALSFVNLGGLEARMATQLSGGQQQRLALARALVYEPDVLLLDEPLSNLDAKLRHQMRVELKKLQQKLGTTFIFVTHDQVEAMSLAHRVAVMRNGRIEQIDTPDALYQRPATSFVHSFLGTTVTFEGKWATPSESGFVELTGGARLSLGACRDPSNSGTADDWVLVTIRPDDFEIVCERRPPQDNEIEVEVESVSNLGDRCETAFRGCDTEFVLQTPKQSSLRDGDKVLLRIDPEKVKVWPKGQSIES